MKYTLIRIADTLAAALLTQLTVAAMLIDVCVQIFIYIPLHLRRIILRQPEDSVHKPPRVVITVTQGIDAYYKRSAQPKDYHAI